MTLSDTAPSPAPRIHDVTVGVGETLLVRDWGPLDGPPVVVHHALPACSLAVPGGWGAADEAGVRLISFDRPGYGRSPAVPGRSVADGARWTAAIADSLGLDGFSLFGTGGGAPHAAAAAAVLGERVHKMCLANGLGPDELPGFDPASEMMAETRHEIACARAGEPVLREFLESLMANPDPLEPWFRQLRPSDVELLGRRDVQLEDVASYEESMRAGLDGWIEDDLALFRYRWGCDFSAITAQTVLLHGLDDVFIPASHGDAWKLVLGHGQLVKLPDAGHWLRDYEIEVLRWMGSGGDAPLRLSV